VGGSPGGRDHSPNIFSIVNIACRTWLPAAGMHVAADVCSAATRFFPREPWDDLAHLDV